MRSFLVLLLAISFGSTVAAQSPQAQSRWTLSAGVSWPFADASLWGLRARANYDLTRPYRPLQLQLEAGALWGPTHSYFRTYQVAGGAVYGENQTVDLTFGLSASLSPLPRARFSPYLTAGILARQVWSRGWSVYDDATGLTYGSIDPQSRTLGQFVAPVGLGIRARIGGRQFQIEYRFVDTNHNLTLGTRLPF